MKQRLGRLLVALVVIVAVGVISANALRASRERAIQLGLHEWPVLILNGEYVPGPYTVTALDDQILINDKPYYLPREPAITEIPAYILASGEILSTMNKRARELVRTEGVEAAEQWALSFLASQPEVLNAELEPGSTFAIHWAYEGFEGKAERIGFNWKRSESDAESLPRKTRSMHDRAEEVRSMLTPSRGLVILTNGNVQLVQQSRSAAMLQLIRDICNEPTDAATKSHRLRSEAGVGLSMAANVIAERLVLK
jgi:hypothetical protein